MARHRSHFWKKAPFVKILLAFAAGILLQWHFHPVVQSWWLLFAVGLAALLSFFFIPYFSRYKLSLLSGLAVSLIFLSAGGILSRFKDVRRDTNWLGHYYQPGDILAASLDEPLVEKTRSCKADATINYIIRQGQKVPAKCRIIIYFRKDSTTQTFPDRSLLRYGSQIIFKKPLQEINNSGNPGGFDYKRYSLFRGITYQLFLKPGEFEMVPGQKTNPLKKAIFSSREKVLDILRKNIPREKERGLAEALLIGYKDDLEQPLVQSYTNTGVVHIIAISGLHLGLIYWLLALLLQPLRRKQLTKWLRPVLIICGLWAFSLLAGAQPSVLRSALMFSIIVLGEAFDRKTSIYNSLAVSAFILLCINPFWLWDIGFQLSYTAVLSIIIFMRPVYNWFYCKNKILDFTWKLNAVTLAAQILTVPLSIYHFHQFPSLFFLANFLAVPLSGAILLGEILLCLMAFIPGAALLLGKGITGCIWLMNTFVERVEWIPGSLWNGLQITIPQLFLLLLAAAGFSYWLMEKQRNGLIMGLITLLCFTASRSLSFIESNRQQKIIVYNIPQKRAIDFIDARNYVFVGDSDLQAEGFARNFHLKPCRILHRASRVENLNGLWQQSHYISYKDKRILLAGNALSFGIAKKKQPIDLLIVSGKPRLYFEKLLTVLDIKQVVFDSSVPAWKVNYLKKDCDSLQIPYHDVSTNGAFVMNLN